MVANSNYYPQSVKAVKAKKFAYRFGAISDLYFQVSILEKNPDGLREFTILIDANEDALYPIDAREAIEKGFITNDIPVVISEAPVMGSNFQVKVTLTNDLHHWRNYLQGQLGRISSARNFLLETYKSHEKRK